MGNSKSKKQNVEPQKFFDRERFKEIKLEELRSKKAKPEIKKLDVTTSQKCNEEKKVKCKESTRNPAEEDLDRIRYQLHNDTESFLLNHILLSVQFFENFERESQNINDSPINEAEYIIDEALLAHHKHAFFPDRILECVDKHVRYSKYKGHAEPISTPRMFVIYDNIEANEAGDSSNYSTIIDAPYYKLRIEDCKEPGYVKLKKLEVLNIPNKQDRLLSRPDYSDSEKDSTYSEHAYPLTPSNTMTSQTPKKKYSSKTSYHKRIQYEVDNTSIEDTETSGYLSTSSSRRNDTSETDSDYCITKKLPKILTPKRIKLSTIGKLTSDSTTIPKECWTSMRINDIDYYVNDEDEQPVTEQFVTKTYEYLNSSGFMTNFVSCFMTKICYALGVSQNELSNATTYMASINCNLSYDRPKRFEIIPCLATSWPQIANSWIIRPRNVMRQFNFDSTWPNNKTLTKATHYGCFLIPSGFRPRNGINHDQNLQWKVMFPPTERYLESCLSHTQVRCYLFSLILRKCFMEYETTKLGLDASFIKNFLFWQCESQSYMWCEERLGETLRLFLRRFYRCFRGVKLPDYFIEDSNIFKNIPQAFLLRFQRNLANVIETPVVHTLYAIEKLVYTRSSSFYPRLNTKKLFHILTYKPDYIDLRRTNNNVNLDKSIKPNKEHIKSKNSITNNDDEQEIRNVGFSKNSRIPKRLDIEKKKKVLEYFITHFIATSDCSINLGNNKQSVFYLEQAKKLSIILFEISEDDSSKSIDYMNTIEHKMHEHDQNLVCDVSEISNGGLNIGRSTRKFDAKKLVITADIHNKDI